MDLDFHTLGNVYHVLLIHVPANQPFLPPSFALTVSPISHTDNTFWHTTSSTETPCQMNPTSNPRGRARNAPKTPYSHVNAVKNLHLNVQDIIRDCPAVDLLLGNNIRRSSTHNRARDKGHVRRPPNAFMIYRSYAWYTKLLEDNNQKILSDVSKDVGRSWRLLGEQTQRPFRQVAAIAQREHRARNPDYKYAPLPRSQKLPKKLARRAPRTKVKAKVKESATHGDTGLNSLPLLKQATSTPACQCTPRASSDISCPSSSPTPTPPSTPPTPMPRQWALNLPPSSPALRYPRDHDNTDYSQQPCVRPVTSGLIPSPSMSVLHLNGAHTPSILDELPDVSPMQLQCLSDVVSADHHSLEVQRGRIVPRPAASRATLQRRDSFRSRCQAQHADLRTACPRVDRLFRLYFW